MVNGRSIEKIREDSGWIPVSLFQINGKKILAVIIDEMKIKLSLRKGQNTKYYHKLMKTKGVKC